MASILDPQFKLDVDGSTIDCNWYYGCIFNPKKHIGNGIGCDKSNTDNCNKHHDAIVRNGKSQYSTLEKDAGDGQRLREEGNCSRSCSTLEKDAEDGQRLREEGNCSRSCSNLEKDAGDGQRLREEGYCSGSCSTLEKDAGDGQRLREEGNCSRSCCGLSGLDSAEVCKEDEDVEVEWLASMFRVLDEDGDGRVSVDEMMRLLQRLSLGMPVEEVEMAVRSVSGCGDEFLTALEFVQFYRLIFSGKDEEGDVEVEEEKVICEAFGVFDQNGDGFISAMELAEVLCRLGFVEGRDVNCCRSMIERVDSNGDGFVDIHEFRHLIAGTNSLLQPSLQCVTAIK